jgi:uncharacterized GH25 family protein
MSVLSQGFGLFDALLFSASAGVILGHNFWLTVGGRKTESLRIELHTGHHFPAGESAIAPDRIADFRLISARGETTVRDPRVEGTALVAEIKSNGAGAQLAVLALHPRSITLGAEKFAGYLREEDAMAFAGSIETLRRPQREIYSKYAKAILTTGNAGDDAVACRVAGQKMEIVPEHNPACLRRGQSLPIRVFFDGEPAAGVRVSSGCDKLQNGGYASHARTGADGRAEIDLPVSGHWFVRSHSIRRHPDPRIAEWESFWPSLTFRIDD